jgi:uncharacterized protein YndB with AHSA1/START domain
MTSITFSALKFPIDQADSESGGMGTIDYSVWIHASPDDVWVVYVDPSRIPEWQTGSPVIEEIHGAADQPGSSYVSRRRPGAARTTVVEVDRPRSSAAGKARRSLLGSSD